MCIPNNSFHFLCTVNRYTYHRHKQKKNHKASKQPCTFITPFHRYLLSTGSTMLQKTSLTFLAALGCLATTTLALMGESQIAIIDMGTCSFLLQWKILLQCQFMTIRSKQLCYQPWSP